MAISSAAHAHRACARNRHRTCVRACVNLAGDLFFFYCKKKILLACLFTFKFAIASSSQLPHGFAKVQYSWFLEQKACLFCPSRCIMVQFRLSVNPYPLRHLRFKWFKLGYFEAVIYLGRASSFDLKLLQSKAAHASPNFMFAIRPPRHVATYWFLATHIQLVIRCHLAQIVTTSSLQAS